MDTTVADPLVGQVLDGRYRVESRIARGGMATVYVARDIKLDRRIALKVMHANLAQDEDFVRRFIGEAKAAAALSHPNVVAVYDQGTDGQHVFLAMEYVRGRTLRALLTERGRLGPREALGFMQPILAALAAAHRAGLVHRDVKPENVLLTEEGQVKVADFGLARAETAGKQTKTGLIIGTVGYLAPEQVLTGHADVRSDVYAAGIMLFELLTGRQPHTGDTPLAVAYKHVNDVVPPPSSAVPGLPSQLDTLVTLATSRDPARRPQDAGAFLAAVSDVVAALPPDIDERLAEAAPAQEAASVLPMASPPAAAPPAPAAPPGPPGSHTRVLSAETLPPVVPGQHPPPPAAPPPPPGPMERVLNTVTSRYVLIAIGALAAVILGWAVWYQVAGQYERVPEQIVGMKLEDAKRLLAENGLVVRTGPSAYSDKVPKGHVVTSDPGPGQRVEAGGVVTLTLSKGKEPIPVPDTAGKSLEEARKILQDAGFTPGEVIRESSQTIPKDQVIRTAPKAGKKVSPDQPVDIVVSSGMEMPNLVNVNAEQAANQLRAMGLEVKIEERDLPDQPRDVVLEQNPPPGTGVSRGDQVTLVVNKKDCILAPINPFCHENEGGPDALPVPTVLGQDVKAAVQALRGAGFDVEVIRQLGTGRVIRQEPGPNGTAPRGHKVKIWH
ncbi:Stk1 family PASTA domain-containing Ser/Thr kinase [Thermomonospora catenispora]|uniref:Stk1 family PASTA domain-containing Ser/Thr kinase n=1 Tax=Thermomonospora catenispora TaxID=2493090 RepID=UPI0011246501|nr:Stk1 family PASTA domain-containing Ser/Thr kinase [Thermomonospora catenispora]TNY36251.1 Stk1 family PASTA domain-containing Ser/Thr kinase [Thermomonospora catenispora]